MGWRQSAKSVAAQEALNLTLFVEHCDPVLSGNEWQRRSLRYVSAVYLVVRCDFALATLKNQISKT